MLKLNSTFSLLSEDIVNPDHLVPITNSFVLAPSFEAVGLVDEVGDITGARTEDDTGVLTLSGHWPLLSWDWPPNKRTLTPGMASPPG